MPTRNQLLDNIRKLRRRYIKRRILDGNPQRKGVCTRISVMSPNKPNAGKKKVVRAQVVTGRRTWVYIPGETGHTLQIYSNVLIRGGRVQDLPVQYKGIRNKYDLGPVIDRKTSRSKYGSKFDKRDNWKKKQRRLKRRF